jgi:hypothetical protein
MPDGCPEYPPSLYNHLFERDALRVIFGDPPISRVLAGEDLRMIDVADLLAGININPGSLYLTILYFLEALRRGSDAGSGFPAFTALRTAISANINGPRSSTAAISISTASSHSGLSFFVFGSDWVYSPASRASRARCHQARRSGCENGATKTRGR